VVSWIAEGRTPSSLDRGVSEPKSRRKVILVKDSIQRVRKDKGERGTIETEMKAENRKNTCMVIPMQVPEELITGSQKAFLLLRIESDPFV